MILYGELTKVEDLDDGTIRVHGVASTGGRDSVGEVVSPDAIRKALPAYMAFPAIREMHQAKAAGAALHAEVDDSGETRICAHVVDPVAVKKVKAGVYKGLSIGGKVLARDPADPSRITEVRLDEISLVDRPCNPEAVIDLWKAAALRAPTNEEVRVEAEAMAKAAGRPGRRNDYVAAARAKLAGAATPPPAHPGERRDPDHRAPNPEQDHGQSPIEASSDQGPGVRRDERQEGPEPPLAKLEGDLAKLTLRSGMRSSARLNEQAAEIARLKSAPLPPRTAASPLVKAVAKTEDGEPPLSPEAFADALAALPAGERAHLIMKAALARPIAL